MKRSLGFISDGRTPIHSLIWEAHMKAWYALRCHLPTLLTLARLFSPGLLVWLFSDGHVGWFLPVTITVALTDWLDGYLARRWHCETQVGAALDILADKVFCMTLMGFGAVVWNVAWWYIIPCFILVGYHVIVLMLRVIGNLLFKSSKVAKAKMLVEMIGLIVCLGSFGFTMEIEWLDYVGISLIWTASGMAFWSVLHYLHWVPDLNFSVQAIRRIA